MERVLSSIVFKAISKGCELFIQDYSVYPLEGLSACIKVALLAYSPEKSKLSFGKSVSIIQPTIYTPFLRTVEQSSRLDIQLLSKPLQTVLTTYSINKIEIILQNMILGLNSLKSNYRGSIAEQAIDLYIQQIEQALTTKDQNPYRIGNWNQEHIDIVQKLLESLTIAKSSNQSTSELIKSVEILVDIYQ